MTRPAYYNEIDAFCCDVLRARIADGSLPFGDVDPRDIRLVQPLEIAHYGQIHLFAGIGGGGLACRLAGLPDDFRIVTAGVPCQPASVAGSRLGDADERWLWPEFFRLLRGLESHYALVEQPPGIVSLHDGREWGWILGTLAELRSDLELSRVSAEAVGAPQGRERIWIVAYPECGRVQRYGIAGQLAGEARSPRDEGGRNALRATALDRGEVVGDSDSGRCEQHHAELRISREPGSRLSSMGDTASGGWGAGAELGVRWIAGGCETLGHTDHEGGSQLQGSQSVARRRTGDRSAELGNTARGECGCSDGRESRRDGAERSSVELGDPSDELRRALAGRVGESEGREESEACGGRVRCGDGYAGDDGSQSASGELGDTDQQRRQELDDAALAGQARQLDDRCEAVGDSTSARLVAGGCIESGEIRNDSGRAESERRSTGILGWSDAVAVRGYDGSVRLIPKDAATRGPQSPLFPVAPRLPGVVARHRGIGNAWCPQAAGPALRVIAEHARAFGLLECVA